MKKAFFALVILFAAININAQEKNDGDDDNNFWSAGNESKIEINGKRQIIPQKYVVFKLDPSGLKRKLFSAPDEKKVTIDKSSCIITFPTPNGSTQRFRVVESSIMEPALAAQFPDIKTFSIKGIDDPYANGKADWNEFGFHGMIRSVNGDFFIDPYCVGNTADYIVYYTKDFVKDPSQKLPEAGLIKNSGSSSIPKKKEQSINKVSSVACVGSLLRTYRLALACTGEYAVAATGLASPTIGQTLSKIVTSINRVDGVYETEVSVRMVLVATETNVIFTNAATDPFTGNNNANVLIGESQTVITNTIGTANFDIGHTFSTGGGGYAALGVVCTSSQKASGITGSPAPVGDAYDIDYVAHEMGHQFGADHTFNAETGSCGGNRNGPTAVEPGSGITIMAYAGICGSDDLSAHSIPYFQAVSYDEIVDFVNNGTGALCSANSSSGNQPPAVSATGNYRVPKGTAFILTGSATDPDGDPLTYSWEQIDAGTIGASWNSGSDPYFMSYAPVNTPSRSFPNSSVVATGNYTNTKGEYVPDTAQVLSFRLTARDNKMGGGGVCSAVSTVTVDASGPFSVTYPNASGITWLHGGQETITWNVNGTNAAPVSCDSVSILLSYDGGLTYSVMLNSTPNDGAELVSVPSVTSNIGTCRIRIESKGNIFYDVSNNNFTISIWALGIKQISQSNPVGLSVWPNPFNSEFNLSAGNLSSNASTDLCITDILGKIVCTKTYSNRSELNEKINLDNINAGIYFISVTNNNMRSVHRIIKN